MTVSSTAQTITHDCNGSDVDFTFPFSIGDPEDIKVVITSDTGVKTTLTYITHYSVTGIATAWDSGGVPTAWNYDNGGTVTTVATYASGYTIQITTDIAVTQEESFIEGMNTLYKTFEQGLDKITRILKQFASVLSVGSVTLPLGLSSGGTGANTAAAARISLGIDYDHGWVNVKDPAYGCLGNDSADDTVALNKAIDACNLLGLTYDKPTLYGPYGIYRVQSNALHDIKTNFNFEDATIRGLPASTNTLALLSVDYHSTVGQFFKLRALHGADWGGSTPYNCGLQIKGADNSYFNIRQFELLDTCLALSGSVANYHIAQNRFDLGTMMSFNKAVNLTAGTNIQCETNTLNIEYIQMGVTKCIGIYTYNITGANSAVQNNHVIINTAEHGSDSTLFYLDGTTPAQILQNVFEVTNGLSVTNIGAGHIIHCAASIGVNRFALPYVGDSSLFDFASRQIINPGPVDWTNGRSIIWAGATPSGGYWAIGDVCWKNTAAAGGSPGWICTTAGSQGTWKAMANVAS